MFGEKGIHPRENFRKLRDVVQCVQK